MNPRQEGNLQAPTRHPIDWNNPDFYDEEKLHAELERVFDLCHGCRRCVSLCNSFPTLFDLVDESDTMEVDGVDKADYAKVVDECYLCDICYSTKCPYTPPHEWNIDFPHLMLRAKATNFKKNGADFKAKTLSSTDAVGKLNSFPVMVNVVNSLKTNKTYRSVLESVLGVHPEAHIPDYANKTFRKSPNLAEVTAPTTKSEKTQGKVAIFATCYGNYNEPDLPRDLVKVLNHNDIEVRLADREVCCGMPKLELGDLASVAAAKEKNIPMLAALVREGWDIIAPVPSCVLMFKQELPLMFPDDEDVQLVGKRIYDPFEYLMLRHSEKLLNVDFKQSLGKVAYHAACHQRVQMIGQKTKECLSLIEDTDVTIIERCSGHDGTYGVKSQFYNTAKKIVRPVVNKIKTLEVTHHGSDCPMAGRFIEHVLDDGSETSHPISLLRKAYGI